jgi:hypothetical protein
MVGMIEAEQPLAAPRVTGRYHVVMARKHTKAARPARPTTTSKPSIVRKAAKPARTLSLKFDGQIIALNPEKGRRLLSELCRTATEDIQTFHAVQREVEAQRLKMREVAKSGGIDTDEVLRRCEKSGYPVKRITIDRAVAAGELPAFVTIGLAGHYRMIRPEDFEKWNRARIARIARKEAQ